MENDKDLQQTHDLIARDLDWDDHSDLHTVEELIGLLSGHIAMMIEQRPEFLFSMMYRLDIREHKVRQAMDPGQPEPPPVALARLVVERQKQRLATKKAYRQEDLGEDAW